MYLDNSVRTVLTAHDQSGTHLSLSRHSTKSGLLVLDWQITSRCTLVLLPNEVTDLLILGLLDSCLIVLLPLTHEVLLDVIDTWNVFSQY